MIHLQVQYIRQLFNNQITQSLKCASGLIFLSPPLLDVLFCFALALAIRIFSQSVHFAIVPSANYH